MPAKIDSDRDLLFGLLALQTGLVDQEQLVTAFRLSAREKTRPMEDVFAERNDLDEAQRSLIAALVDEHLKKHGGDASSSLAAFDPKDSTRKALLEIGDVGLTTGMARAGSSQVVTEGNRTLTFVKSPSSSDGRRFRLLRPHARGGLGVVFVALDQELHREVAVKEIQDSHADDPASRARFVLEAEITGGLEHPGIVPVYGLGTHEDGRPYYAMRFIRGDSLKDAIARFHADAALKGSPGARGLALRKLLRRFVDVCNAIEYAHGRGVLHRDLKPGNVMVGKYGETLVVDWGVAKATGRHEPASDAEERTLLPRSASGSSETLPGSAIGTPSYMSPEQAAGELDRLGPRSDVYSLGATLYCLLVGHSPFDGRDAGVILQAVRKGQFPLPRSVDASIPSGLEAISLKAMALKPDDRYASPRAMAEDVERWMADEPISARRDPWIARAARWGRRHRTLVVAAAAVLVSAVAALSMGTLLLGAPMRGSSSSGISRTKTLAWPARPSTIISRR